MLTCFSYTFAILVWMWDNYILISDTGLKLGLKMAYFI